MKRLSARTVQPSRIRARKYEVTRQSARPRRRWAATITKGDNATGSVNTLRRGRIAEYRRTLRRGNRGRYYPPKMTPIARKCLRLCPAERRQRLFSDELNQNVKQLELVRPRYYGKMASPAFFKRYPRRSGASPQPANSLTGSLVHTLQNPDSDSPVLDDAILPDDSTVTPTGDGKQSAVTRRFDSVYISGKKVVNGS